MKEENKPTNKFLALIKQQDDKFDSVINKIDDLSKSIKSYRREQIALSIILSIGFLCFTIAIIWG